MKLIWVLAATMLLATLLFNPAYAQDDNSYGLQELLQREDVIARIERGRPKPTFDLLFDQYAQAVWDANAANTFIYEPMGEHLYAAALPDEVLLQWEERWGDDPRWWELRWYCADLRRRFDDDGGEESTDILLDAIASGHASPAILQLAYVQRAEQLYDKAEYGDRKWYPAYSAEAAAELRSYLDDFIRSSPERSWGWFQRGLLELVLGNDEAAMRDFNSCGDASEREMLLAFPLSTMHTLMRAGKPAGSLTFSGMLLQGNYRNPPGRWFIYCDSRILMWKLEKLLSDEQYSEMNTITRALATAHRYYWWELFGYSKVFSTNISIVRWCLVDYPDRFSREQRSSLYSFAIFQKNCDSQMRDDSSPVYEFGGEDPVKWILPMDVTDDNVNLATLLYSELTKPGSIGDEMIERGMGHFYFEKYASYYLEYWSSYPEQERLESYEDSLMRWDWTELDYEEQELTPEMQKLMEQLEQQMQEEEGEARQ